MEGFRTIILADPNPVAEELMHRVIEDGAHTRLKEIATIDERRDQERKKRLLRNVAAPTANDNFTAEHAERIETTRSILAHRAKEKLSRTERLKHRYEFGYVHDGATPIGGKLQDGFVYKPLKSRDHPHLQAFVRTLPRLGKLKAGQTKEFVDNLGDSKVHFLDYRYIEGNKEVVGFIRTDNDGIYDSPEDLKRQLHKVLDPRGIPLPHLAVGEQSADGRIHKPHLITLLPVGNGVRTDEKANWRPIALLDAVSRALCHATLSMNSDPGGMSNPLRVKNPLSPHWTTVILNEDLPLTLAELGKRLDLRVTNARLQRDHAVVVGDREGMTECQSNSAFTTFRAATTNLLRHWHRTRDVKLDLSNREKLMANLMVELGSEARHSMSHGLKPQQAMAILYKVCAYLAVDFNPARIGSLRDNPGCMKDELQGVRSLRTRQSLGAHHTATKKRARTLAIMVFYMKKAGSDVSKARVARDCGLSKDTVYRLWNEAVAGL
ncbi:hypothetical protein [Dongia sp.]|uniref:hypothetical protein n=1 Tax=Dongia sp. TaxID=1977262 RepID=UPI0035B15BC4